MAKLAACIIDEWFLVLIDIRQLLGFYIIYYFNNLYDVISDPAKFRCVALVHSFLLVDVTSSINL